MSQLKDSQHLKLSFKVIKEATENFKTCIGKGGYGRVYKGQLLISGQVTIVAVKRLYEQFGQGSKEFLTEIELLRGQKHPNLISLLGYCEEGEEKIIVYEYAERGSLDQYISLNNTTYSLSWLERLRICVAIARGLDHLHNHIGKHQAVIHRDIKSANILLDHNWVAKISDLGLSKLSLSGLNRSAVISNVCGTPVYCEPEYMITGIVKKESDVFSFGMVLLEILCGRLCTIRDEDGFFLLDYYKRNKLHMIIDSILRQQMSSDSLIKFLAIVSRCLHKRREQRHPMDRVVKELEQVLKIEDQLESSSGFPKAEEASGSQLNSINSFVEDEEKDAPLVMGYDPTQVKDSENMQFSAMVENMSMSDSEYEVKIENERLVYQNELDISSLPIIKNEDLEQLRELGSDKFGTLYHGKWRGTDVAIQQKKFAVESSEQERLTVEFWREAAILSMLRHPNIVAFYGVVQDGPGGIVAAVTESVDGTLRRALLSKDRHLNGRKRHMIAMDVAFGMEYLHSQNIVHFDLKCEKLLVNIKNPSHPVCKVGNFGLSRIKRNTLVSDGVRGTLPWMAPELLNGSKNEVSEKVDVFSFGIVLWEILTGEEPYADMQDDAIIEGIVSNTLRPSIPKDCDHEWRRLMEQCWAPNPAVRPSFTEITLRLRCML